MCAGGVGEQGEAATRRTSRGTASAYAPDNGATRVDYLFEP
jgi:hypothetical protein